MPTDKVTVGIAATSSAAGVVGGSPQDARSLDSSVRTFQVALATTSDVVDVMGGPTIAGPFSYVEGLTFSGSGGVNPPPKTVRDASLFYETRRRGGTGAGGLLYVQAEIESALQMPGVTLTNFASGGSVGTAASTVDIAGVLIIPQTTQFQTITLPNPTDTAKLRTLYIINTGTVAFMVLNSMVCASAMLSLVWNGAEWIAEHTPSVLSPVGDITNRGGGGDIGTAAATVDIRSYFTVNQSTVNQTATLPNPTDTTRAKKVQVVNVGTVPFTMYNIEMAIAKPVDFVWTGVAWNPIAPPSALLFPLNVNITNKASGGDIGTAAATVDIASHFNVAQTTAAQTLTLPNPSNTRAGRLAFVTNTQTENFNMHGVTVAAGRSVVIQWDGGTWRG